MPPKLMRLAQLSLRARPQTTQTRHYSSFLEDSIPTAKRKYVPSSGTYPHGFLVSGTHVGVKPSNTTQPDLALIASTTPCSGAAVFTKNKFQAAPVTVSRSVLVDTSGENLHGIIINAGCANAVTGAAGLADATSMATIASSLLAPNSTAPSILVMSTGVIGQCLPISKILSGIPHAHASLSASHASWLSAARAICTTDTFPKLLSTSFALPSAPHTTYALAGMAKGAGMIHPNMATLLGVLCTDAPLPATTLRPLLTHAADRSFNAISVDGDTSTNDTFAVLANGAAGGSPIHPGSPDYAAMQDTLTAFAQQLAQLVVRDGEGATKLIHVRVVNCASENDARAIAASIARSPLVKTAMNGGDANWGRILCAVGYTAGLEDEGSVDPGRTSVSFVPVEGKEGGEELRLLVNGEPEAVDEERAGRMLKEEDVQIRVDMGTGEREGEYWFCDFGHGYIDINADYRT